MAKGGAGGASGAKGKARQQDTVVIPPVLEPLFGTGANVATNALQTAANAISGDTVAPFSPTQQQAQAMAVNAATDPAGGFQAAQDALARLAGGQAAAPTQTAADWLTGLLTGGAGGAVPFGADDLLTSLIGGGGTAAGTLASLGGMSGLPDATRDALEATTRGDFLYGGPGFQESVDAAVRAAQPGLMSAFGSAGAGGASGGLARTAIARSGIDAALLQQQRERDRQIQAANMLGGLNLADVGQRAGINQGLLGAGLSASGQAQNILNTGLGAAGLLGDIGQGASQRSLAAAGMLPQATVAPINLLSDVGAQQQAQAQREISAPFTENLQLFAAALGLPFESLLGKKSVGKQSKFGVAIGKS